MRGRGGPQRDGFQGRAGGFRGGPDAAPMMHFHRLMQAAQKGDPRARKMLEHMYKAIGTALAHGKKAKMHGAKAAYAKKKKLAFAKSAPMQTDSVRVFTFSPDFKGVKTNVAPTKFYTVEVDAKKVANKRREAAIKLMKVQADTHFKVKAVEKDMRRLADAKVDIERAKRIAELRAQAVKLQIEIEQLKRELAK